jgi:hypothetical protein
MTTELRQLLRDWWALPGNERGGALHIVVDDFNTETHHILWCYENASIGDRVAMYPLMTALLAIPEDEREAALEAAWR